MATQLEAPGSPGELYRARGDEVNPLRPMFTGDVYENAETTIAGETAHRIVQIIDYPCDLRTNGIDMVPEVLVVEVVPFQVLKDSQWQGFGKIMPLPGLRGGTGAKNGFASQFERRALVAPEKLGTIRIATLSQAGVNLLHQRLAHRTTRVVIPTLTINERNVSVYEEADLIEDWCTEREDDGLDMQTALTECMSWLRDKDDNSGSMRQDMLKKPQERSTVRQAMRAHLRKLRKGTPDVA